MYPIIVIVHCNSLRSRIAGAAIDTLQDMFQHLRKKLIPNLQAAVGALMIESGKENTFIREKCDNCFQQIVDSMIGTNIKLVLCLGQHLKSKNVIKRVLASRFLNVVEEIFGVEKCLGGKELTDKVRYIFRSNLIAKCIIRFCYTW